MIRLEGISVRFGGIVALGDGGLEADAGEVLGIIGPNGAGKTTLFDVISGVRIPNEGRVRLDGIDVTGASGTPEEIQQNQKVRDAYLGDEGGASSRTASTTHP